MSSKTYVPIIFLAAALMFFTFSAHASDSEESSEPQIELQSGDPPIHLLSPDIEEETIDKKPLIHCRITGEFDPDTLYIELDYSDVTVLAKILADGFELAPVQVLPPGEHTLAVRFSDDSGQEVSEEFVFTTRHTRAFETFYSENTVSGQYTRLLEKRGDAKQRELNQWEAQANISTQNKAAQGPWELTFTSNARYQDQELPMDEPMDDGLELADYLLSARYSTEQYSAGMDFGDISVTGTRNTYNGLSRRGGSLTLGYGPVTVSGFTMRSDQAYGIDGEWGLDTEETNHFHGGSGTLTLMDDRLEITLAHIRGGEITDDSYGLWSSDPGGIRGKATGLSLKTDFFDQKARAVLELGWSDYDEDTSDGIDFVSDDSLYAEISGDFERFNYQASYEHNGPNYQVPGNSGVDYDREGFDTAAGYTFEYQSVSLRYSRFNDNVDDDLDRAVITTSDYGVDYNLSKFESVPISLSLSRSVQESDKEPSPWDEMHMVTDTCSGNVSYMWDQWSISLSPSFSDQDDRTSQDSDSDTKSLTLSSTWSGEKCMVSGSVMVNESTYHPTDLDTTTYSMNLAWSWTILDQLTFESNASMNRQKTSDDSMDQDYWNADLQLTYSLEHPLWGILSPQIMLKCVYDGSEDRTYDTDTDGTLIYLALTGDLQLSF